MNDIDAVSLRERLIAMRQRLERAQPGEIKVAEKAGRIIRLWLNQRDLDRSRAGGQVLGGRGTAYAPTDDDNPCLDLVCYQSRAERCEGNPSRQPAKLSTRPELHGLISFFTSRDK